EAAVRVGPAATAGGAEVDAPEQVRPTVEQLNLDLPDLQVRLLPALAERLVQFQQVLQPLDVLLLVRDHRPLQQQRQEPDRRGGQVAADAAAEVYRKPLERVRVVGDLPAGRDGDLEQLPDPGVGPAA